MQALWSRSGQSQRCGCRPCNISLATARRRSATAARQRKLNFAEIFTACYGSLFATAAVVDAVRKDKRRREIEQMLEEARRDLTDLRESGPLSNLGPSKDGAGAGAGDLSINQMDALWRCLKTICKTRPHMKEIHKPATITDPEFFAALRAERYAFPSEATLRAARRCNFAELERAVLADEADDTLILREALTKEQLSRESFAVRDLVDKLLSRTLRLDKKPGTAPSYQEACDLARSGANQHTFRGINSKSAKGNTVLLNQRLRIVLDDPHLRTQEKIGRVCYNLLISKYAADTHTYNTLIVGFTKAGMHPLADAMVHSFFRARLLQPTPATFLAILNHYKATGNHGSFIATLACISGANGSTGAKVRRRHIDDLDAHPFLLSWAMDARRRTLKGNWVYEHLPISLPLVEEIIYDLLHFNLYDQAVSFFLTCVQWGIHLRTKVVKQVLDECVVAVDWKGAVRLIRGLGSIFSDGRRVLLTGDDATDWYIASRIYTLLDLLGLRGFKAPVSEACLANLDISRDQLGRLTGALEERSRKMKLLCLPPADALATEAVGERPERARMKMRLMQLEAVWKEYVFVRKTTCSIESKLLNGVFSFEFRMAMAVHIGNEALQRAVMLGREADEMLSGVVRRKKLVQERESEAAAAAARDGEEPLGKDLGKGLGKELDEKCHTATVTGHDAPGLDAEELDRMQPRSHTARPSHELVPRPVAPAVAKPMTTTRRVTTRKRMVGVPWEIPQGGCLGAIGSSAKSVGGGTTITGGRWNMI